MGFYYKKDYILWEIEYEDGPHYFATVKDAEGEQHNISIKEELYMALLNSNRKMRNCASWDERNTEYSEITEATLNERAFRKQKSVEQIVIEKLRDEQLWLAVDSCLTETQKRRVTLHYYYGFTYREIAEMEFRGGKAQKRSSPPAISKSIGKALKKIKKFLKK